MTSALLPNDWRPVGVNTLEPAADAAVRSIRNSIVIAGPGAGKTELLAQRACYLLQTGICPRPRRILAISFKRDAARNLQDRVVERCGKDLAQRFDSQTFDAFAKSLVDRFRGGIPPDWCPTADYRLTFDLNERTAKNWLELVPSRFNPISRTELEHLGTEKMYREVFAGKPLPPEPSIPASASERAALSLWGYLLRGEKSSVLNFHMIGRLAELLLRANPQILQALRATYAYVFLDEFQDTTAIQYQLTETAFLGSSAILTAVGDNKQRIMGWAGALDDIFMYFQRRFHGDVIRLRNNYRSAPELVRILGYLTKALDNSAAEPMPVDDGSAGIGECRILLFPDHIVEAENIAGYVAQSIAEEKLRPRDFCILTRNRPDVYTHALREALQRRGIEARVESELQDMLSEPIVTSVLSVLKVAARDQSPEDRTKILDMLLDLAGVDDEAVEQKVERHLNAFVRSLRSVLQTNSRDRSSVETVVATIVDLFGRDRLKTAYAQYSQGTLLEDTVTEFINAIASYLETLEWSAAIDALEGVSSVPIMTMHKSKGLEYHTVIFVGLEDSALWTFANRESEETCGFFVAFSRARKRVCFTFCGQRPKKPGGPLLPQKRASIGKLYDLLQSAGITPETIT